MVKEEDNKYYERSITEVKKLLEENFRTMDRLFGQLEKLNSHKPDPIIDPTANVLSLVAAETKRADDLRVAESRRVNEIMELRAVYSEKLSIAESKRIDAIRSVDVGAVAIASDKASQQAAVLASQVAQSAEALRTLVSTTNAQVAASLSTISNQLGERISIIEKSQYEKTGIGGVPAKILDRIDKLENLLSETKGRTGMSDKMQAAMAAIAGSIITFAIIELVRRIPP